MGINQRRDVIIMSESVRGRRWRVRPEPPAGGLAGSDLERAGRGGLSLPPLIARLLTLRGVRTEAEARAFLHGDSSAPAPDALPGMDRLLGRLLAAIAGGERIAVYGDYDVDGVTATAILAEGLGDLGADVLTYVPNRFQEGYGLSTAGLRAVRDLGAEVVISVDCGINAVREVEYAAELGLDVVVLDHHAPPPVLPNAAAIVDPKLGDGPPDFAGLASCGLAFTTLRALYAAAGRSLDAERFLDLAALGTVADMVPLMGENRRLVRDGLKVLSRSHRPGVRALLAAAGLGGQTVDAADLAFKLAPRINAAGRLEDAALALELFTTPDERRAEVLAAELSELNACRQRMTDEAVALARRLAAEECAGARLIMVGHAAISQGIVGLVAGKLVEEWYRPSVVYEWRADLCHGSVRGIPEFDVVGCLAQGDALMERWGGHSQAGGFTVRSDRVARLRTIFTEWAEAQLRDADLRPVIEVDLETPLSALRGAEIRWLQYFEPCGQENPTPVFLSRRVAVIDSKQVGADRRHLRLKLRDGAVTWPAVAFDLGHAAPRPGQYLDVVYSLTPDRHGFGMELQVKDFALSQ